MSGLLACFALTASVYGLPPRVLPAILRVEGGRTDTVSRNANGTEDLGPMQINSRWLPGLGRYVSLKPEEVRARLLTVPCFNVAMAGAILRGALEETHGDLMRAIGDYHSHTPGLNQSYRIKVARSAQVLFPR